VNNGPLVRALTALVILYVGPAHAQRVVDEGTVIENVTLISPERRAPLLRADVVLRDGRIAEIGRNLVPGPHARRINGSGRFLIPGLIDSHVHAGHSAALDDDAIGAHPELWAAYRAQVPRAYLAFGFTSIVDLDLTPSDKAWFEGTTLHPRFYSCGRGIKAAGGYMVFNVPSLSSPNFPNLVYEPKEAEHWPKSLDPADYTGERAVSRAADAGAICVKAFVESGFGTFNWPYCTPRRCKRSGPPLEHASWCSWFMPTALPVGSQRSMLMLSSSPTVSGCGRATSAIPCRRQPRAM
jgi:hypothetical protein